MNYTIAPLDKNTIITKKDFDFIIRQIGKQRLSNYRLINKKMISLKTKHGPMVPSDFSNEVNELLENEGYRSLYCTTDLSNFLPDIDD